MQAQLRDYQHKTVGSIEGEWAKGRDTTLAVLPTGSGKTVIFLALLDKRLRQGGRALVLAHRKELVEQPRDRILDMFPDLRGKVGIVMAEQNDVNYPLTIGTVQTLAMEKRLQQVLKAGPIDTVVVDECFPAGTLVDGRPIETLRVGDKVTAYDAVTRAFTLETVTHVFKRPAPTRMLRVTLDDGAQFTCTPNHPVFANNQFVPAEILRIGDSMVRCTTRLEHGGSHAKNSNVSVVWDGVRHHEQEQLHAEDRQAVLRQGVQQRVPFAAVVYQDGRDEPQVCQCAHARAESHARPCSQGEDAHEDARPGIYGAARRERAGHTAAGGPGGSLGLADGGGDTNQRTSDGPGLSDCIQSGCGQHHAQGGYRSGRQGAQAQGEAGRGRQEDGLSGVARVARVEVLELGGGRESGAVCADGFVYNLEVTGPHTYTANGIVVHNCHHYVEDSAYAKVWQVVRDHNPNAKLLGVTATPIRADEDSLGRVFKSVAVKYSILDMIKMGNLVPVRFLGIQTGIDLSGVARVGGDFNQKQLSTVFETEAHFDLVVKAYRDYGDKRRGIAFTTTVAGAEELAETFRRAGIRAASANGMTNKDVRSGLLRDFREGRIDMLVNVGIWTEGLDLPEVEIVLMDRPTQSDGLYTQMIGRGLRLSPGKTDCLVLDFLPVAGRNIVQAGDVLGLTVRKDAYTREVAAGEVAAGFVFGPGKTEFLTNDAAELIATELDMLDDSIFVWHKTPDGWLTLGLGAADGLQRTLLVSPPDKVRKLYMVTKLTGQTPEEMRRQAGKAYEIQVGDTETLLAWAEEYASKRAEPTLAQKQRRWRKEPASENQRTILMRRKLWKPGMSKGVAAQTLTALFALDTLRHQLKGADDGR